MIRTVASLSLIVLLAACGSSAEQTSQPQNLEAGDIKINLPPAGDSPGPSAEPLEVVFAEGQMLGFMPGMMVAIGNKTDICARLAGYAVPRNSAFIGFGMYSNTMVLPEPGTYREPNAEAPNVVVAQRYAFDQDCEATPVNANTAQLELTSIEHGKSAIGKFTVHFADSQEPLVGEFHATYCDAQKILEEGGLDKATCVD